MDQGWSFVVCEVAGPRGLCLLDDPLGLQRRDDTTEGEDRKTDMDHTDIYMPHSHLRVQQTQGVDLSDQLIQYYRTQHKTMKWYWMLFLHFLDIAATNAYILHKELASRQLRPALTHKAFMEELTAQLCGMSKKIPLKQASCDHIPVPVAKLSTDVSQVALRGRRTCVVCRSQNSKNSSTPWKCRKCDVPLCLQLTRNCFEK